MSVRKRTLPALQALQPSKRFQARPEKPDPIQEKDVTKDSYTIKVRRQDAFRYEYGIAESESGEPEWKTERTFTSPLPAHTYYVTIRVKATGSSFASKPADRLKVTTPDALLIDGPAGAVSFETTGTYGQTLDKIHVQLAEKFKVVNYGRSEIPGTWKFSEVQKGTVRFLHLSGSKGNHCISGGIYPR